MVKGVRQVRVGCTLTVSWLVTEGSLGLGQGGIVPSVCVSFSVFEAFFVFLVTLVSELRFVWFFSVSGDIVEAQWWCCGRLFETSFRRTRVCYVWDNRFYIGSYINTYLRTYVHTCMYVCMYVCMQVCMQVCTYVHMYVQSTLPVQIGTTGSTYRKRLLSFCY